MSYDSTEDTKDHIANVQSKMALCTAMLAERSHVHDQSKLQDPEKAGFDEYTPKLKGSTYGSPEYKELLAGLSVALNHHYANNSHHPEYHEMWECPKCKRVVKREKAVKHKTCQKPECLLGSDDTVLIPVKGSGILGMSLFDLIEMLVDWKAATERHDNGDIIKSLEINKERFGMGDVLDKVFMNTIEELGWNN